MNLNNGKVEFQLDFSTASYMQLKGELKCDNLRKTLLQGCNKEDYEMLAKGIKVFSGSKVSAVKDAYVCIDYFCKENEMRRPDMFVQFVVELGENGFFGEVKTAEEIKEMALSPEMEIDMSELTNKAMEMFKEETLRQIVLNMAKDTSTTGAVTLTSLDRPLTKVE